MRVPLQDLSRCFQGVIPSILATCSGDGEPNVTYLSQVFHAGPQQVALSCQFFNKTRRNIERNPYATVIVQDPIDFAAWRLRLRFDHSETEGPLFEVMATRIQVIASHTGMAGVFRLISADVYEVLAVEPVDGFLLPPDPVVDTRTEPATAGPLTELRGLQMVSERIARAADLEALLSGALAALDELLGFSHSMLLLLEDVVGQNGGERLVTIASRGYGAEGVGAEGVGAEVVVGEGVIGMAASRRRMLKITGMGADLRYGRAIRQRVLASGGQAHLSAEVPLPGLSDAQAQLALPLLVGDRLLGVLAVESRDPLCFDEWDEAFLQIVANQIGLGIDRMQADDDEGAPRTRASARRGGARGAARRRTFVFYRSDDCVFVDGEYLVRNVPGRILWKLLCEHRTEGRSEFTNRELRLDPWLGLPALKDNLESRLILLRKRLLEKCPDLQLVPVSRGRFALKVECQPELVDKEGT